MRDEKWRVGKGLLGCGNEAVSGLMSICASFFKGQ